MVVLCHFLCLCSACVSLCSTFVSLYGSFVSPCSRFLSLLCSFVVLCCLCMVVLWLLVVTMCLCGSFMSYMIHLPWHSGPVGLFSNPSMCWRRPLGCMLWPGTCLAPRVWDRCKSWTPWTCFFSYSWLDLSHSCLVHTLRMWKCFLQRRFLNALTFSSELFTSTLFVVTFQHKGCAFYSRQRDGWSRQHLLWGRWSEAKENLHTAVADLDPSCNPHHTNYYYYMH